MSRVLIIDDEESICWGLTQLCEQMSLEAHSVSTAEKGLALLEELQFDLIISDVRLPGKDGISAIQAYKNSEPDAPVLIITAFGDLETAIDAIQNGAFEYIVKPFELDKVRSIIRQAIATRSLTASSATEGVAEPTQAQNAGLVGSSRVMQEVFKQIALTTTTRSPVLISGESGTGKELTARSIHRFGIHSSGPFVAVNIAALNPSLIESELFGHVKGAFTGADSDRIGLIQQADGGTLFLDEVAEIPIELQVKLLRVLDLGEVIPVGSNHSYQTNFRLISATHQDLLSQINHGDFRHDLFYRLRTFEIKLPPLRQRKEDIPALVNFFLSQFEVPSKISASAEFLDKLKSNAWPGNVRELQSVVARASTLARGGILVPEHVSFDETTIHLPANHSDLVQQLQSVVKEWTKRNWNDSEAEPLYEKLISIIDPAILPTAFDLSDRQYSAAARKLGIHRTTLKKKLDDSTDSNLP